MPRMTSRKRSAHILSTQPDSPFFGDGHDPWWGVGSAGWRADFRIIESCGFVGRIDEVSQLVQVRPNLQHCPDHCSSFFA